MTAFEGPPFAAPKLRFVLPIRTSKRKAEAKSPQQQTDLAMAWAKTHGHEIVAVLDSGKDESGKTMDRSTIHEAMAKVTGGEADGIVFAITDRLGRAPIEESMAWIRQLNLIGYLGLADAGGEPVRLSGKDPSRETMLVIQLQFARQYWLNTAARFRQSQRDAVKAGKWIGRTPLGYGKTAKGRLVEHEVYGPIIRRAFVLAAREGLHAAVAYFKVHVPERQWTTDHVRRVLGNRAYLGEYRFELKDDPGNFEAETLVGPDHTALADLTTWTAAQTEPGERSANGDYPLSHRVHCARCGAGMTGGVKTTPGYRRDPADWRKLIVDPSKPKRTHRRMACSAGCANSISADKLEGHLRDVAGTLLASKAFRDQFNPVGQTEAEEARDAAKANLDALVEKVAPSHPSFETWNTRYEREYVEAEAAYLRIAATAHRREDLPGPGEMHKPDRFEAALRAITRVNRIVITPGRGSVPDRVNVDNGDQVAGSFAA